MDIYFVLWVVIQYSLLCPHSFYSVLVFGTSSLSGTPRYSRLILHFPCPSPEVNQVTKVPFVGVISGWCLECY